MACEKWNVDPKAVRSMYLGYPMSQQNAEVDESGLISSVNSVEARGLLPPFLPTLGAIALHLSGGSTEEQC